MAEAIRVTVWNEGVHEKELPRCKELYPKGMGQVIGDSLKDRPGIASVRCVELDDPDQGLSDAILQETDVMTWWGHCAHDRVSDENAAKVKQRVLEGMGLIVLHSGHFSKPFISLMGSGCDLKWREYKECGEKERLWIVDPSHPIVNGLPEYIELPNTEMYGEHFDIPQPDQQVFISWFQGGEVFRSGCCWQRGQGKIFYFRPGHETFPIYYNAQIQQVLYNAVRWAAPVTIEGGVIRGNREPLEKME